MDKIVLKKFKCVPKNLPQGNEDGQGEPTMRLDQTIEAESYKEVKNDIVFYDGPLRERLNDAGEMEMMKTGENIIAKLPNKDNWTITIA